MEKGIMCPSQTLVDNNRAKFMNCQDFLTRYGIFKQFLLNEMMWTAGIQMKWVCDHRSESQFKQLRK